MSEIEKKKAVRQILLWQQIGCIVVAIAEKLQVSYKKALDIFYASDTCRRLHDERSGLYLLSDLYLADEVVREQTVLLHKYPRPRDVGGMSSHIRKAP